MTTHVRHKYSASRFNLVIVLIVSSLTLLASETNSWSVEPNRTPLSPPRIPADPQVASRLVARMVDAASSREDRYKAYAELVSMEPGEVKHRAFLEALRNAPEDTATLAAGSMLCEDTPVRDEVDRIVAERLTSWSPGSQSLLFPPKFNGCSERKSNALRFIPRTILRDLVDKGKEQLNGEYRTIATSALLLAGSDDPQDNELLAKAVLAAPEVGALWRAIAQQGAIKSVQATLARSIVQNPEFDFGQPVSDAQRLALRVAAATALSPDKNAEAFAVAEIRAYLSEFSTGEMNPSRLPRPMGKPFADKYQRYKANLQLLGNLMYLQSPAAQEVTFEYLDSPDFAIRRTMAVVTAKRWPQQLMKHEAVDFAEDYGANSFDIFLAIAAFYHPDLEEKLLSKGNAATIQSILDGSRRGGIGWGWQGEGGVVIGGW